MVAAVTGVSVAAVACGVGGVQLVHVRNCGLTVGIALLSVYAVPAALGWAPVVLLGVVTWLIGVPPPGELPPAWALLLAPGSSSTSLAASATILVAATTVFALATPQSSDAGDT